MHLSPNATHARIPERLVFAAELRDPAPDERILASGGGSPAQAI